MKALRTSIGPFAPRACAWRATRVARSMASWATLRLQWRRNARPKVTCAAAGHQSAPVWNWQTTIDLHFSSLHQTRRMFSTRTLALPAAAQGMLLKETCVQAGATPITPAAILISPARPMLALPAPSPMIWRSLRAAPAPGRVAPAARRAHNADPAASPGTAPNVIQLAIAQRVAAPPLTWKTAPAALRRTPLRTSATYRARQAPGAAGEAVLWRSGSPPLVWQKTSAAQLAAEGEPYVVATAHMAQSAAAQAQRSAPMPATPAAEAMIAPVRQQLQAAALDPVLADRLANEVIRRVERSMRIERERRGY